MPRPAYNSAHARYAAHTAAACGFEFRSLDGADGYLFEVRDQGRRAVFASGAGSPYALNDARAASVARDKAFCAEVLRQAGVPVVAGRMFFVTESWRETRSPGREPADALAFAQCADYPVFCKPISASNGLYAEIIESCEAFAEYMGRVAREHFAILVQPYLRAPEYRVFVLEGRALLSYRKSPPEVVGDGASTLAELAASWPVQTLRARDAGGRGFEAEAVLARGVRATLEGPANRAVGGGASEFRDGAPAALARQALAAARALGLHLAGVDMFAPPGQGPVVIEVNSNPMIATLEDHKRWDLIEVIWRANFNAALQ